MILGIQQHCFGARISGAGHGSWHIDFKSSLGWQVQRQFHGPVGLVGKNHPFLLVLVTKLGEFWIAAFRHCAIEARRQHRTSDGSSKGLDESSTAMLRWFVLRLCWIQFAI